MALRARPIPPDSSIRLTEGEDTAPTTASALPARTVRAVLGSLALVMLLAALDSTVVATALPRIVSDLQGNDLYAWVFTVYLLTMTVSMPMFASLSDRFGRRAILQLGLAVFLGASALCGLASDMWQLILFRGIQGFGAGAVIPITMAIVGDLFTPEDRARYQPLLGSTMLLAFLIGPTIGGVVTDDFGWRWIFYMNLPVGLLAMLAIWRSVPVLRLAGERHHFDLLGLAVFAVAVVPFLVGLKNKTDGDWADPAVGGLILLGLAAGAVFVFVESRAAEPIVPVALFRDRTFAVACAVVLLSVAGLFVSITFLPRFFQFVRGASATESGWQIMALLFGLILGAIVAGQIVARTGHWKAVLLVGMAIGTIGMLALTRMEAESDISFVWAAMFVTGVGIGPVTSILTAVVQTLVSSSDLAVATGTLTFFRQLGASIWLAIGGSIFTTSFTGRLPDQLSAHGVPAVVAEKFGSGGGSSVSSDTMTSLGDLRGSLLASVSADVRATVAPFVDGVVGAIHQAFSVSIGDTFWVGILPVIAAFVMLALLKEVPIPKEALKR